MAGTSSAVSRLQRGVGSIVVFSLGLLSLGLIGFYELAEGRASAAAPDSKVNSVAAPHGTKPAAAKIDARGVIHLVCDAADGPRYHRSNDGGATWSHALPLVGPEARRPGLEFIVWDLAVNAAGDVHVALGTNAWKLKLPKEEWGFFYARLKAGDSAFAPVRNINRKPSEGFSLAADDKGNVTACWLADKLYANVSHDGGATFGETREIDPSFDPCNCCTTSITYGADGKLAILYREETNNDRDMFVVLWDQKAGKVTRQPVSTTSWKVDACPMTYYSIVPLGDGYLTVWPTKKRVYFARLDAAGKQLPPTEVATHGQSGMRTGLRAITNGAGDILIVWNTDGGLGWQLFGADCRPLGDEGKSATSGKGAAVVVDKKGRFVVIR